MPKHGDAGQGRREAEDGHRIERGSHYTTGSYGAEWFDADGGGWSVLDLGTANYVGEYATAEDLLRDFPEFKDATEVANRRLLSDR